MDTLYELCVRPSDERETRKFESALHDFVAIESRKPRGEASSVFARCDAPTGRWILAFETSTALEAFREHWRTAKADSADEAVGDAEPPTRAAS